MTCRSCSAPVSRASVPAPVSLAAPPPRHPSFRDPGLAANLLQAIHQEADPGRIYRFMEFCGGHTHALCRFGLLDRLPVGIRLLHGPGCPVCVLPRARIDMAIRLLRNPNITLCTYGDLLRVPGSSGASLLTAKAAGGRVNLVYSPAEVLALAQEEPRRQFVFFAIGFETTTPATALLIREAQRRELHNLTVFCNHVLTLPAMHAISDSTADPSAAPLDGLIGPGHVSLVTGLAAYDALVKTSGVGVVVTGFEPLDLLQAILLLVRQVNAGYPRVENQYRRAVTTKGNAIARQLIEETFVLRPEFAWRGLGTLPESAWRIRDSLASFDAEQRFAMAPFTTPEPRGCACPDVLRGRSRPEDCPLYASVCTPERPVGACMVSPEGACAAHYLYRRHLGENHA